MNKLNDYVSQNISYNILTKYFPKRNVIPPFKIILETIEHDKMENDGFVCSVYDDGSLKTGFVNMPTKIITIFGEFKIKEFIDFYRNENIKRVSLLKKYIIKTSIGELKIGNFLSFYKNGQIKSCCIEKNQIAKTKVGEIRLKKGILFFHENGEIKRLWMSVSQEIKTPIGKLKFSSKNSLRFYDNGNLKFGKLAKPYILNMNKTKIKFYDFILFDKKGMLKIKK